MVTNKEKNFISAVVYLHNEEKQIKNFLANQVIYDDNQMIESIDLYNNDFKFLRKGLKENKTYMREKYKW